MKPRREAALGSHWLSSPCLLAAADLATRRMADNTHCLKALPRRLSPLPSAQGTLFYTDLLMKLIAYFPQFQHRHAGGHVLFPSHLSHCFLKNSPSAWSIWLTGKTKTPRNALSIGFPFSSTSFCLTYFDVLLLGAYTFRTVSSWRIDDTYHYVMVTFILDDFVILNLLCLEWIQLLQLSFD